MKFKLVENKILADDVYEQVRLIHHRKEDFDEGDIEDRIFQFSYYIETEVPVENIDNEDYNISDDIVDDLIKKIKLGEKITPVVLYEYLKGNYDVIDGVHRVTAYKKLGIKNITAWVGLGRAHEI
jgi:hypothetical protein